MNDRIFLISDDETLKPMESAPYVKEDLLQALLERYPDLLAGEQVNPDNPRRWLLVKREAGIGHSGEESHSWRLDHLFLDQDGVPTLVETKIAENPELRRKVVGQMLDYASNVTECWSMERIRHEFEETCEQAGVDAARVLAEHLSDGEPGDDVTQDDALSKFWVDIKTNLEAGRLRLVFIADRIPSSLLRIVEFLNTQMDPCEVIAIELRQYLHEQEGQSPIRTIVPRVHGVTATSRQRKSVTRSVNDPGIYILEPVVEMFESELGMTPTKRMFRKGWLRFASTRGGADWLIYQSRTARYVCIYYDGYAGPEDDARFDAIIRQLENAALPSGVELAPGYSNKYDLRYISLRIPGFDFEDDGNWDELRGKLMACMRVMLPIVDGS